MFKSINETHHTNKIKDKTAIHISSDAKHLIEFHMVPL